MTGAVLILFILFIAAAMLFFCTAVVITVIGIRDLKDLLQRSMTKKQNE